MPVFKTTYPVRFVLLLALCLLQALASPARPGKSQSKGLDKIDLERGHAMLVKIRDELKRNYYDPTFHGLDIDARFREYDEKIRQARSINHLYAIIAQFLLDLNDSHTVFSPPARQARLEYGWRMQMIGNTCFVVAVKPGSDAEEKGVRPGDIIHQIADLQPTRSSLWKIEYLINRLAPQDRLRLTLQAPTGHPREIELKGKLTEGQQVTDLSSAIVVFELERRAESVAHLYRQRVRELDGDLVVWKVPSFELTQVEIDSAMGKVKGHKGLVLDLRGNGGGRETALLRLLGHFLEKDTKVGDLISRKETKPLVANRQGHHFAGRVVVLIDSHSASAAEVFARMIQIEKRGTVLGDNSLGRVMRSRFYPYTDGLNRVVFYGANVTVSDLVMSDGKRLEGIGVTPDQVVLPTGADMAARRDPVLARAAALLGAKLSPEDAGKLFPTEWLKDN